MEKIINQVTGIYKWDTEYAQKVALEYSRFLQLRFSNNELSPSDDIDKFWHQHILNTRHYKIHCETMLGKFVDHDPTDSLDQTARMVRLKNTIDVYINKFGPIKNTQVWAIQDKVVVPPVEKNIFPINPNKNSEIYIKIIRKMDEFGEHGEFIGKIPKGNPKLLAYKFKNTDTMSDLKNMISKQTGHNKLAIKMYVLDNNHKNYEVNEAIKLVDLSNKIIGITAELEEMSQHGYC